MSILQKIEKCYGNLIESIKLCLDKEQKMIMIGSLAIDIGKRCISALSKIFHLSRKTIRKAICLFKKEVKYKPDIETRKYTENSFKKSVIANLLNKMGYNLKKVKKNETIEKN